ncbi:MAG: hypothetical protein EBU85_07500 [Actinobacteria bacterium]|nr:hypothetical protein [Actinomycetota bacterium]
MGTDDNWHSRTRGMHCQRSVALSMDTPMSSPARHPTARYDAAAIRAADAIFTHRFRHQLAGYRLLPFATLIAWACTNAPAAGAVGTTIAPVWGWNYFGQCNVPSGKFSQLAAGAFHTAALTSDGTIVAWGSNTYGECNVPPGKFAQLAAGYGHNIALKVDGTAVGWGRNDYGQCNSPQSGLTLIAAGINHSLGLRPDGTVLAWGFNTGGQCNVPVGEFVRIAGGYGHSLALRSEGRIDAWGENDFGQCSAPQGIFTQIAAGFRHSIALRDDGVAIAWGSNAYGQCDVPQKSFNQVAAGYGHSTAIGTDGVAHAWGWNDFGQCAVPEGTLTQISSCYLHTAALRPWSDCDDNGAFDGDDIAYGGMSDLDHNFRPDSCQGAVDYRAESGNLGPPNPVRPAAFTFTSLVYTDADVTLTVSAKGDFEADIEVFCKVAHYSGFSDISNKL